MSLTARQSGNSSRIALRCGMRCEHVGVTHDLHSGANPSAVQRLEGGGMKLGLDARIVKAGKVAGAVSAILILGATAWPVAIGDSPPLANRVRVDDVVGKVLMRIDISVNRVETIMLKNSLRALQTRYCDAMRRRDGMDATEIKRQMDSLQNDYFDREGEYLKLTDCM